MKRPQLVNDEIYHVVIRGVAGQEIFKDRKDYFRMIFSLYEFNTQKPVEIREVRQKRFEKSKRPIKIEAEEKRNPLVELLSFCLMPNHVHLLLRQLKEQGISQFMRKIEVGYAGYFNRRHERMGYLFQGRFQAVHIQNDAQLRVVFVYIHANPVSLIEPIWKRKKLRKPSRAIEFVENYKWSSFQDYIGKKNFPSLTKRDFITEVMGDREACRGMVEDWIRNRKLITKKDEDIFFED